MASSKRNLTAISILPILFCLLPTYGSANSALDRLNTLRLQVDATDVSHRILKVAERIPVLNKDEVTLYFPKWIPGTHSPSGPIDDLSGLIVSSRGQRIEWHRDPIDMNAFHVDLPKGTDSLDVQFQMLCSESTPSAMTSQMIELEWNTVSLYPTDIPTKDISIHASLRLPAHWGFGTALKTIRESNDVVEFETSSYMTLVDSPVLAGANFKQVTLDRQKGDEVRLNIAGDKKSDLDIQQFQTDAFKNLVSQAEKLFKSRHYQHYDFLLSVSDQLKFRGLEHHESSEDGTDGGLFTDWGKGGFIYGDLMPHEYVHSWNGKYRRPADLTTNDYAEPMRNSLLWVYEGQTQYWGEVLAVRSGLLSPENAREYLALDAAVVANQIGREWRDLQDTTNSEILSNGRTRRTRWHTWQRSLDYYYEGALIWLDADAIIRERSKGKRSLDDFASLFFGEHNDQSDVPLTYNFDDLVGALNKIEPFDWRKYFTKRLTAHDQPPLDGLSRSGYKLIFTDKKSDFQEKLWKASEADDFYFSLGIGVDKDGKLSDVVWNSPAFSAGLSPGMILVAVNGEPYTSKVLDDAIVRAKSGGPIEILVKAFERYRTVSIDYRDGPRYPHLEKIGKSALLDKIFAPK